MFFKSKKPEEEAAGAAAAEPNAGAAEETAQPIGQVRRRLSVVSDNKLVDGIQDLDLAADDGRRRASTVPGQVSEDLDSVIWAYNGVSKKGYAPYNHRKKNQDVYIAEKDPVTDSLYLCVMDGHGEVGDKVTAQLKKQIPGRLFAHPDWATDCNKALAEVIDEVETELNGRGSGIDTQFSGTTYTSCIVRNGKLYCANCGDSRVTLGSVNSSDPTKLTAKNLTDDHKPDDPEEKKRIVAKGGRVFAVRYDDGIDGPPRVWLGHMDVPGLAMSRSLGDMVAHDAGVSSELEFSEFDITDDDKCLILASDGLWEFMSDQEVIDMAHGYDDCTTMVNELVQEANNRWMREEQVIDDTTVIVAMLGDYKKA